MVLGVAGRSRQRVDGFGEGGKSGLPMPRLSTSWPWARIAAICFSFTEK